MPLAQDGVQGASAVRRRTTLNDTVKNVPPTGVEPAHMASEANALSAELRGRQAQPTGVGFCTHSRKSHDNF